MQVDKFTNNVQNIIEDEQEEEDKVYMQLETMDQVINLLPKRIKKDERQFQADKFKLLNIAQQESMIDANLKNMKPFKMSELLFPGEEQLFNCQPDKMLDKVILLPQGITKQNILKMKFDVNIPQEIQKEYNITYKLDEKFTYNDMGEEQKAQNYTQQHQLKLKPKQDSDYLYQLASQERLRKFKIKSSNEYYLYTDIPPTQEDIEKRAQILAKLFCKYNLKDEQEKLRKKEEDKIRIKHHEQIQMAIISKVLKNEDVTKEDLEKAKQQIQNTDQDVLHYLRDQKLQKKKAQQLANQPQMVDEEVIEEKEEAKDQQQGATQNGSTRGEFMKQNQMAMMSNNNIGYSQVPYNKNYEDQINSHIKKITEFYQNKLMKYYSNGQLEKAKLCQKESQTRMKDFQSIHNPEVLLRHLLFIRQTKKIF